MKLNFSNIVSGENSTCMGTARSSLDHQRLTFETGGPKERNTSKFEDRRSTVQ